MGAQAEGMVGRMKSAVGELPGFWLDTFQAMADGAATALAEATDSALQASDSMLGAAAPVAAAWEAMSTQIGTATSGLAGTVDGNVAAINGALAELDGAMADVVGSADGMSADLRAALAGPAGAADGDVARINGALGKLDSAMSGPIASADKLSSGIKDALAGPAASADGDVGRINGALDKLDGQLLAVYGDAGDLEASMRGILAGPAATAGADAAKINDALAKVDGSLARTADAADKAGLSIEGALTGGAVGATAGGGVIAGGGGKEKGKGKGGIAGALAAEERAAEKEAATLGEKIAGGLKSKLGGLFGGESSGGFFSGAGGNIMMGGIAATMMPSIFVQLADAIEKIGGLQQIGGGKNPMTVSQALELSSVMSSVNINPQSQARLIARLEKNIMQGTGILTGLSGNNPLAAPQNLGLGRLATNPGQIVLGGPTDTMARLFALAGVTPSKLQGMNALQQIEALSSGLGKVPKQSERTAAIQELFGGGRGSAMTGLALMMADFPGLETQYKSSGAASAAAALTANLPKNAVASAANLRMGAAGASMSLESIGIELIPVMEAFTRSLADFTKFANDLFHGNLKGMAGDVADFAKQPADWLLPGGLFLKNLAKGKEGTLGGLARKGLGKIAGKVATGAEDVGGKALDLGGVDLAGLGADILPKLLGPLGIAGSLLLSPSSLSPSELGKSASPFAQVWQKLVAPHADQKTFSPKDVETAIVQAAKVFGLDAKAMLADSFAEAHLSPTALNKKSGAAGIFQFTPGTFASDTKRYLGQALPQSYASNPYIASMIAAASMSQMGIGGMTGENALKNMIGDLPGVKAGGGTGFEHPGAKGAAGDLSRGLPFLQQLENDLKTKTPAIKRSTDALLLSLNTEMEKYATKLPLPLAKTLGDVEKLLISQKKPFTAAGVDMLDGLLKGLQREEPKLDAEVRKVALQLENTLRAALKSHSPSEVMAAIGADIVGGLALGVDRTMPGFRASLGADIGSLGTAAASASTAGPATAGSLTVILQIDGRAVGRAVVPHVNRRNVDLVKLQGNNIGG